MGTYTDLSKAAESRPTAELPKSSSTQALPSPSPLPLELTSSNSQARPIQQKVRIAQPLRSPDNSDTMTPRHHDTKVRAPGSFIQELLQDKSISASTYRFPAQLVNLLDEVHYELRKPTNGRVRVSKNDLVIAGLASALLDFEQHGVQSLFYKLFVQDV